MHLQGNTEYPPKKGLEEASFPVPSTSVSRNGVYAAQCGLPADFLDTVESSGSDKAHEAPVRFYRA